MWVEITAYVVSTLIGLATGIGGAIGITSIYDKFWGAGSRSGTYSVNSFRERDGRSSEGDNLSGDDGNKSPEGTTKRKVTFQGSPTIFGGSLNARVHGEINRAPQTDPETVFELPAIPYPPGGPKLETRELPAGSQVQENMEVETVIDGATPRESQSDDEVKTPDFININMVSDV